MITDGLKNLRECFINEGFDIRFVGGCVRDTILGLSPKDIDLCTDANPDEQKRIYDKGEVRCFDTGLKHGTWTVLIDDLTYEITSLRTETDHDGRHANVQYIKDWYLDAERRDLTFNAMSMTFDGEIIDPFGGQDDLKNGAVRFVGDANARIQEDYLRILRWYRFNARFGKQEPHPETWAALINNAPGLQDISSERVWSEMKPILAHEKSYDTLAMMQRHNIFKNISLRDDVSVKWVKYFREFTNDPVVLLAMFTGGGQYGTSPGFDYICIDWKLSNEEAGLGKFVLRNWMSFTVRKAKELLTENVNRKQIFETMKISGVYYPAIEDWIVPVFPINGHMLIDKFSGPQLGTELKRLRQIWYGANFQDAVVLKEIKG